MNRSWEDDRHSDDRLSDATVMAILTKHMRVDSIKRHGSGTIINKMGADVVVTYGGNTTLVDFKVRWSKDYGCLEGPTHNRVCDDLALETWSDIAMKKLGWTRDPSKATDLIIWYWVDTLRSEAVLFKPLCAWWSVHWEEIRKIYGPRKQTTEESWATWYGECVFVPRWKVLYETSTKSSGVPPPPPRQENIFI